MDEKLHKVLAGLGFGSRREMERWITAGRVQVNGKQATLGDRVTESDKIAVDGRRVRARAANKTRVLLYNKAAGELCTRHDPEGRPTVFQRLPGVTAGRWINVGRLDFNTSGLLLFTTDGKLAHALMHPSSNIDREYAVRVQGDVSDAVLDTLRSGVQLEDGMARFSDIQAGRGRGSNSWFYVVLQEGRNREVRRLWESQGLQVSRLKRVRFGNIVIPSSIKVGRYKEFNAREVNEVYELAGLGQKPRPKRRAR